ncbi:methylmalonyl-CoA mutase N-terminal domain/subunit [Halarchaeum solikamskense]|uniref:DUF5783 family protein n=1 Tax=Halarchaeum nitratireducens TaxID=489913 RepID=UPI001B3ADC7B|nr:DUF5783 family protein [Halarchaeum solikamskense]MBP2251989.1 methylmalonyl-CoA mutase N-terminal domain/subunit [Halarchaeum solikamskense]
MADFTPDEFEEGKYTEYFAQLQTAYKRAFNDLNERYDSTLVHSLDQQVLNESEPHYEGDGEFSVELPANPIERLDGVVEPEKAEAVLERYVEGIEHQLRVAFDFEGEDGGQPKA